MKPLILSAIVLGIVCCALPGVVTAEALRRGLLRGLRPVMSFQMGALAGIAVWATASLAGAAAVGQHPAARGALTALGLALIGWMAWGALTAARTGRMPAAAATSAGGDFLAGLLIALANPLAAAFWLGVGAGLTPSGAGGGLAAQDAAFLAGFLLGYLTYCLAFAALIEWGRRFVTPTSFRWINALSAVTLAYFALRLASASL